MRDDNGSGYKSTCGNEKTVDETGLSRMRELVYELSTKWTWFVGPGLGRIEPGSTGSCLDTSAWLSVRPVRVGCAHDLCARADVRGLARAPTLGLAG